MKKLKILVYSLLFIYFLVGLHFLYNKSFAIDSLYQFGFSYAFSRGEIPYLDFSMIVTPLSTVFYTIPLLIKVSYLFFNIFQALILTLFFAYLFKRYDKKAFILLIVFACSFPFQFVKIWYSGYSFLLIVEFIILMVLEEEKEDGFLTGIILSLVFLTKQTVGIPLLGIFIYYFFKDKKKLINMIKGYIIFPIIFLLYLLFTNSLTSFIDICFLGLFDFSGNNYSNIVCVILYVLQLIFLIYKFIKEKNNKYLYLLLYIGCTLPSLDFYHYSIYLFLLIFIIVKDANIKISKNRLCIICSSLLLLFYLIQSVDFIGSYIVKGRIHSHNHYELMIDGSDSTLKDNVNKYIKKYKDQNKKIILISYSSYYYKIVNDLPIDRYDLLNKGNNGLNGIQKLIDRLDNETDTYIIIDKIYYPYIGKTNEYDISLASYVVDNYSLVEEDEGIRVYYKK